MLSTSTEEKLEVFDDGVSPPLEKSAFSPSFNASEFAMHGGIAEFSASLDVESILTICHVTRIRSISSTLLYCVASMRWWCAALVVVYTGSGAS